MNEVSRLDFLINSLERNFQVDLNGDGYIGGEGTTFVRSSNYHSAILLLGLMSKLERWTHFDFNGDGIIGRPYDVPPNPSYYMPQSPYGYGGTYYPYTHSHAHRHSYY